MALGLLWWWPGAGGGQKTRPTARGGTTLHVTACACWHTTGLQPLQPAAASEACKQGKGTSVMTSVLACRPEASLSCFGDCPRRRALQACSRRQSAGSRVMRGASRELTADTLAMAWYLGSWSAGGCISAMVQLHTCRTKTASRSCCQCSQLHSVL